MSKLVISAIGPASSVQDGGRHGAAHTGEPVFDHDGAAGDAAQDRAPFDSDARAEQLSVAELARLHLRLSPQISPTR